MQLCGFLLILLLRNCEAVIYHLNDSAYSRMPSRFALDDYEQCLRGGGTYCLIQGELFADTPNDLLTLMRDYSEVTLKHYNHSLIDRGYCVSKTCQNFTINNELGKTADLNTTLEACLNETLWKDYGLQVKLTSLFSCSNNDEKISKDLYDWLIAAILIALGMLNVIGSLYDVIFSRSVQKYNENNILLCFSVFRNWKSLVKMEKEEPKLERLRGLHGMKIVALLLSMLLHTVMLSVLYMDNPRYLEEVYSNSMFILILIIPTIVHFFFVISGFLLVYKLETYSETKVVTWSLVPKILLLRWLRLTPIHAFAILMTATWLRHAGSGPLWGLVQGGSVASCRRSWWSHLLYINNYVPEDRWCNIPSWYVAADMQLFALGLVVYITARSRGPAPGLLTMLVAGVAAPLLLVWWHDLHGVIMLGPEMFRVITFDDTFNSVYKPGHNHIASWTIGMATGYLVFHWHKRGVDLSRSKLLSVCRWALVPALLTFLYLSGTMYNGEQPSRLARAVFSGLHRVVCSCIIASAVLGFAMKSDAAPRNVLEWRGWLVPSRLTYSMCLLHFPVIDLLLGTRSQLVHVTSFQMFVNFVTVIGLSLLASVVVFLTLEAPAKKLVAWTLRAGSGKRTEDEGRNGKKSI